GEETGARKKKTQAADKAPEPAQTTEAPPKAQEAGEAATVPPPAKDKPAPKKPQPLAARDETKKPKPLMLAAAGAGLLAIVGIGALTMRQGPKPEAANAGTSVNAIDNYGVPLGSASGEAAPTDETALANDAQNAASAEAQVPAAQSNTSQAIAAEKAKAAAAQAQLEAMKKAAAKAAAAESSESKSATAAKSKATKSAAAEITATPDAGVSPATLSQFNSTIDDARSMAKQVMRSKNSQNVELARGYDKYLKTLKASMGGIQTEKEAQRLLKQAQQTRNYIVFLQRQ
ncbi:MAG TPA: hypothetical protein VHE36_09850, partial [Sphingomicrobium sp.]|nr:hypothetical protein [Sphingomicrobium sp.]